MCNFSYYTNKFLNKAIMKKILLLYIFISSYTFSAVRWTEILARISEHEKKIKHCEYLLSLKPEDRITLMQPKYQGLNEDAVKFCIADQSLKRQIRESMTAIYSLKHNSWNAGPQID